MKTMKKNRKNKSKLQDGGKSSKSSKAKAKATSESDKYSGTFTSNLGQAVPKIEISDSVTVYTRVLDVGDLNDSMTMSMSMSSAVNANHNDDNTHHNNTTATATATAKSTSKKRQKKKNKSTKKLTKNQNSVSTTSLDRRVLDAEAKIQKQVRELASDSFINGCGSGNGTGSVRNRSVNDVGEKQKMRLMTTTGVLLFDGLVEDIPDDQSLQSLIRKERREMACQYYNDPLSDQLLTKKNATDPNFVTAPKDYDPIESGFINTDPGKKFYESDGGESENETMGTSVSRSKSKDGHEYGCGHSSSKDSNISNSTSQAEMQSRQDSFEPSIEVVINDRSPLWKL